MITINLQQIGFNISSYLGEEKACKRKKRYDNAVDARYAAMSHNKWPGRRHNVTYFRCVFCNGYHVGGEIPISHMVAVDRKNNGYPRKSRY